MPSVRSWSVLFVALYVCLLLPALPNKARAAVEFKVYLPAIITGRTIFVAQGPSASTGSGCGTSSAPCAKINDAVAQAKPGDTIAVASGVYAENVALTVDGAPGQPITLAAAGDVTIKPVVRVALNINKSHWVIRGFEIAPIGVASSAVEFNVGATNNLLEGNTIHGGAAHGVELSDGSGNNRIVGNTIYGFRRPDGSDAHGVAIQDSDGNLIEGNTIYGNSGDGVQVFTIDTPLISLLNRSADNNRIINNTIYQNDENAVDVKSSVGTVISDNKMWGYKPAPASDGMAVVIHYWARDVVVANNTITESTWGIEVSRGQKGGTRFANAPTNVLIHNNYIATITLPQEPYPDGFDPNNKGNGAGIVVREADGVRVLNNTVVDAAGYCFAVTWPSDDPSKPPLSGPPTRLSVLNNSFSGCGRGEVFLRSDAPLPEFKINYNHYGSPVGGKLFLSSKEFTLLGWQGERGYDLNSITTIGSGVVTGRLRPETLLIDRGTDVGFPFCGTAPDIGAFEDGCGE